MDDLKKENKTALQKQRNEFEKLIVIVDEMNKKATKLQKSNNITAMQKYRTIIEEQLAEKKIAQNTFPTFYDLMNIICRHILDILQKYQKGTCYCDCGHLTFL